MFQDAEHRSPAHPMTPFTIMLVSMIVLFMFSLGQPVGAQDTVESAPTVEQSLPTDVPTTEPLPTTIPTEIPTTEPLPTTAPVIMPTEMPTQAPTDAPTDMPIETIPPTALIEVTSPENTPLPTVDPVTPVSSDSVIVIEEPTTAPVSQPAATKELLITYNPAASEEAIQSMLAGLNAVEVSRLPQIGAMRVLVPDTVALPATALTTLQSTNTAMLAGVTSVESNGYYQLFYTPNDPGFGSQWGLKQGPGGIFAEYAWNIATTRGTGIVVAVIDGGVDLQHPDLANQLVPGWDFINDNNNPDNVDINDPADPSDDVSDSGHGTHVAGIIAAKAGNGLGTAGVAFSAKIMPLKACDTNSLCNMYYIAAAIVHAVDKGAKVINLSLGSEIPSSTIEAAINYALSRNVVVVAAAGNIGSGDVTGKTIYPAAYPGVISVASYDSTGTRASTSNFNNTVDLSAPGVDIQGLLPAEVTITKYGSFSGTSMAAAHVSGVAALILGAKVATTPATVLDALICGAQDAGAPNYDIEYGYGRVQADLSLNWKSNSSGCKVTLTNDTIQTPAVIAAAPYTTVQPIHSRTATTQTSDPAPLCDAIAPSQTLWYSFRPTVSGYYHISILGSSYSPVYAIYQGGIGQLSRLGCSTIAQSAFSLQAAQTYYIVVGTNGAPVDDQVLQLRLNAALPTNNLLYQENVTNIAYSGMWMRGAVTGSSGGYTQQTTDLGASAAFSFRGLSFDYIRTMGPAQGQTLIYLNNDPTPIIVDNRGAVLKGNQIKNIAVPGGSSGRWNTVRIIRDASVPGLMDLDAIKTYDFDNTTLLTAITTKVDDRSAQLRYVLGSTNGWTNVSAATTVAYLGTLKQTDDPTASVIFRTSGNAITISRMTGPGMAPLQVIVDNGAPIIIDSYTSAATNKVLPYTIDDLVAMPHVVEIRKSGALGDGLVIQIDAVQSLTLATLAAGTTYDDRAVTALAYRGTWTDAPGGTGSYVLTKRTLNTGTEVSFKFAGNDLCIGYGQPSGALDLYIDGLSMGPIPASSGTGFVNWCLDLNGGKLVADGVHYVRLVVTTATPFVLDYVRPQRYNTLTPVRGLVAETDVSFRYGMKTDWLTLSTKSVGGYAPQGGYLKATSTDNTSITFYINGSGLILYTGVGPDRACWEVQVDGVLYQPESGVNGIDLLDAWRYRPLGYGIVGLSSSIHKIVLKADTNCSSIGVNAQSSLIVDFDGVRVFP